TRERTPPGLVRTRSDGRPWPARRVGLGLAPRTVPVQPIAGRTQRSPPGRRLSVRRSTTSSRGRPPGTPATLGPDPRRPATRPGRAEPLSRLGTAGCSPPRPLRRGRLHPPGRPAPPPTPGRSAPPRSGGAGPFAGPPPPPRGPPPRRAPPAPPPRRARRQMEIASAVVPNRPHTQPTA